MKNKALINFGLGIVTIAAVVETGRLIYRTGFVRAETMVISKDVMIHKCF